MGDFTKQVGFILNIVMDVILINREGIFMVEKLA